MISCSGILGEQKHKPDFGGGVAGFANCMMARDSCW